MAKMKDLSVSIPKDNIMYTNISKSADGYNSARLVAKMGEKEYMSISYEWEGDGVPGFAMDLMGSMQAANLKSGQVAAAFVDEYAAKSKDKKKVFPFWEKKNPDEEEDTKKKKEEEDKKKKDKKSKGVEGKKEEECKDKE